MRRWEEGASGASFGGLCFLWLSLKRAGFFCVYVCVWGGVAEQTDDYLGEILGRYYVNKMFSGDSKVCVVHTLSATPSLASP